MKHVLITLLLVFSYISIAVIILTSIAGRISRRNQNRLKREAGPKVVDMFAAGEEIRRKNAFSMPRQGDALQGIKTAGSSASPAEIELRAPAKNTPVKNNQATREKHIDRLV